VTLGKLGSMALIGHLDLVRLFDRALRRAELPIAFTGGFHPGPRLSPANALPLGSTSSGEVVDFELTQAIDPIAFLQRLAAQLPAEIPLYGVTEVALDEPSATKRLDQAEYYLRLAVEPGTPTLSPTPWPQWVTEVMALEEFLWQKTTKSGALQRVNLRERLHDLVVVGADHPFPPGLEYSKDYEPNDHESVWLRVVGNCRNDGNLLRPDHVVSMIEQVADHPLQLQQIHRSRLIFV
jgi:radical SAM-linked protein